MPQVCLQASSQSVRLTHICLLGRLVWDMTSIPQRGLGRPSACTLDTLSYRWELGTMNAPMVFKSDPGNALTDPTVIDLLVAAVALLAIVASL